MNKDKPWRVICTAAVTGLCAAGVGWLIQQTIPAFGDAQDQRGRVEGEGCHWYGTVCVQDAPARKLSEREQAEKAAKPLSEHDAERVDGERRLMPQEQPVEKESI